MINLPTDGSTFSAVTVVAAHPHMRLNVKYEEKNIGNFARPPHTHKRASQRKKEGKDDYRKGEIELRTKKELEKHRDQSEDRLAI